MTDLLVAVLAICVGLLLCLRGAVILRTLITVWAAMAGFLTGAGLVVAVTDHPFLTGALSLAVGVAVGLIFGALAYAYFVVAILVAMAAFGFTLGTDFMVAIGVSWSWLVVLVGIVTGLALGVAAVVFNLPVLLLVFLSAFTGSSVVLTGLLFLTGTLNSDDLVRAATTGELQDTWWWWLSYAALGSTGVLVQLWALPSWRAPVHAEWHHPGARQAHPTG